MIINVHIFTEYLADIRFLSTFQYRLHNKTLATLGMNGTRELLVVFSSKDKLPTMDML